MDNKIEKNLYIEFILTKIVIFSKYDIAQMFIKILNYIDE